MRYEYGWQTVEPTGPVELAPTKALAEASARDWVVSPLRTGPRRARTLRRTVRMGGAGYTIVGSWNILDTWSQP